ncbi:MAG TPA: hypothetical protein VMR37_00870 [Rhabdochlamydiaceae bacterium]|nr:hypothetical protein [Rhabdochlamydiaceae bacterium]
MKKIVFTIVCTLMAILVYPRVFSFVYRWVPSKWWTERIAYGQVRDPYHPRTEDYKALQKFLSKGKRPTLARVGDMQKRMRHFCLIGETEDELPQFGKIAVNCSEDNKENCLLVYASFNKAYPQSLKRLVDFVAKSDFKGHILYRIGGWPNVEEGDLKLSMVPYAFKPCFFREAQRLGYKRVLWLDASILPAVSLNRIFEAIGSKGYFTLRNGQMVGPFMNKQAAAGLGVSLEDCLRIPLCSAGIFGVDFSDEKAAHVISLWHQAARHPDAFFSARSDQSALSVILYQQGMLQWEPLGVLAHDHEPLSETTLFKIDRGFTQYGK